MGTHVLDYKMLVLGKCTLVLKRVPKRCEVLQMRGCALVLLPTAALCSPHSLAGWCSQGAHAVHMPQRLGCACAFVHRQSALAYERLPTRRCRQGSAAVHSAPHAAVLQCTVPHMLQCCSAQCPACCSAAVHSAPHAAVLQCTVPGMLGCACAWPPTLGPCQTPQAGAAKVALQCVTHMLGCAPQDGWPAAAPAFGLLLSFLTDARPKVRLTRARVRAWYCGG